MSNCHKSDTAQLHKVAGTAGWLHFIADCQERNPSVSLTDPILLVHFDFAVSPLWF